MISSDPIISFSTINVLNELMEKLSSCFLSEQTKKKRHPSYYMIVNGGRFILLTSKQTAKNEMGMTMVTNKIRRDKKCCNT